MRSSKKYQEIADTLNTVKTTLGLVEMRQDEYRSDNPSSWLLEKIVDQFCFDFKKSNPKFKPDFFRKQVYR